MIIITTGLLFTTAQPTNITDCTENREERMDHYPRTMLSFVNTIKGTLPNFTVSEVLIVCMTWMIFFIFVTIAMIIGLCYFMLN